MNAISIINIAVTEAENQFWLVIDIAMQKPVVARPLPHAMGDVCHLSLGSQCFGIPGLSSRFLALKPHSAKTAPDLGLDRDRSDDLVYMFAICVWGLVALAGSWVGHQSGLALWACHSPVNHVCPAGAARRFDVRTFLIRNAHEVDWLIHHASLHPLTAKAQRLQQTKGAIMNEVNLTGRLGQDPQFWGGESPRATFSIAVETRTEDPEWIPITVFGTQAEVIVKHLGKGRKVAVTGRLHAYRSDEQSSTFISVIARHVEFLDFPKERSDQVAGAREEGFENIAEFPEEVDAS